jgi:hypothetical protein
VIYFLFIYYFLQYIQDTYFSNIFLLLFYNLLKILKESNFNISVIYELIFQWYIFYLYIIFIIYSRYLFQWYIFIYLLFFYNLLKILKESNFHISVIYELIFQWYIFYLYIIFIIYSRYLFQWYIFIYLLLFYNLLKILKESN